MTTTLRAMTGGLVAAVALAGTSSLQAQGRPAGNVDGSGGEAGQSFIGIAIGKPTYGTACGNVPGLTCSNNGTSYTVTAGDMITRDVGIELAYLNLGSANRAGGTVRAQALNLAAVGRVPLGDSFAVAGRVGPTYGITHVNVPDDSGLSSGRDSGVGLGYGVTLEADVARGLRGVLGWEQHQLHFEGQGMSRVQNVTLGLGCRF